MFIISNIKWYFKKQVTLVLILFFIQQQVHSQFKSNAIQLNYYHGYLLGHHPELQDMETSINAVEIAYTHRANNELSWQKFLHQPRYGLSFMYFDLEKKINGKVFSIIPHIEISLLNKPSTQCNFRLGTGLGYLTMPFDAKKNPLNKAIGSHINGCMQINFVLHQKILPLIELRTGLGITHYSNGNFRRPNLGINMPTLIGGLGYSIKQSKSNPKTTVFEKKSAEILIGFAKKQLDLSDRRNFYIFNIHSTLKIYKSDIRMLRIGADYFFDRTYPYELFNPNSLKNIKIQQVSEVGFRIGQEYLIDKLGFVTDIGIYLYRPQSIKKRTFINIGFNYHLSNSFFITTRLKSHLAIADYFEWGVGYKFGNSSKNKLWSMLNSKFKK